MPDVVSGIVDGFASKARILLGDKLSKIILYGSYARGDFKDNSDVDIMILVRDMSEDKIRMAEETLCDLSFDIEIENGLHISAIVKNEEHFKYWESVLPFYMNVRKEGIEIRSEKISFSKI